MNKLSALALAATVGLAALAPMVGAAEAATTPPKPVIVHKVTHKHVCHMVKGKDGKMHKVCHVTHVVTHHTTKKVIKKQ